MSKISLRSYRKEIGALIGKGRAQSAIIHRRHILHFYPKDLEALRLLGIANPAASPIHKR